MRMAMLQGVVVAIALTGGIGVPIGHSDTHNSVNAAWRGPRGRDEPTSLMGSGREQHATRQLTVRSTRREGALTSGALGGQPVPPLLRTLPIAGGGAIAVDELTNHVFVASSLGGPGSVYMLNAYNGNILHKTSVGQFALALAVDSLTGRVFVANQGSHSVSVLDARTGVLLRTVNLRGDPTVVTVAAPEGRVFLANGHDGAISILDARNGRLLHTVYATGGAGPLAITPVALTGQVLVANTADSSVDARDARRGSLVRTIQVGYQPYAIAVDPSAGRAFVSNQDDSLSVLDIYTGRTVRALELDGLPTRLAVDEHSHHIFVDILANTKGAIGMYDTRTGTLLHTAIVTSSPVATPAVDAKTGHVLVLLASPPNKSGQTATGPGAIVALDGATGVVRRHVTIGNVSGDGGPAYNLLAVDEHTQRAFASTGNTVVVLDAARL